MMLLRLLGLALPLAPAGQASPPVPVIVTPAAENRILELTPGEVRCGGAIVTPLRREMPLPGASFGYAPDRKGLPIAIAFRIDGAGRPLGIRQLTDAGNGQFGPVDSGDVIPAFATWSFPAGNAREDCRIAFTPRPWAIDAAPRALLARYFVAPHSRMPNEREIFRRFHAPDTTCVVDQPAALLRAFPTFDAIPAPPGSWSYSMVGFDIDAAGRPVNVRTLVTDGNAALDRASIRAVRQSRFEPGRRTGCTYPYWRARNDAIPAPPQPPAAEFRGPDARCEEAEKAEWEHMPPLVFPEPFRRRGIEGWAVIGYDLAPWGETGGLKVLAAEPAAIFGTNALSIVSRARKPAAAQGATGCVIAVRFALPPRESDDRAE